jgi:hypothetical protein
VSTDSLPRARSNVEVLGSPQGGHERVVACVYWIGMLFMAGLLIDRWFDDDMGPGHPAYALLVATWTFFLTPGVAIPAVVLVTRLLPRQWFRVPAGERVLHRMLGVGNFGSLLERSGWNRHVVAPLRRFDGTRAGLLSLERSALGGIIAHGACFAVHLLASVAALFTGHRWGALWILLPGVALHLYPVLLQRSIMLRLQALLNEPSAWDFDLGAAKR